MREPHSQGTQRIDPPVEQQAKFEAVKTLGVTIPPSLLARADQVLE